MPTIIDLTGQKFGLLTVRRLIGRRNGYTMFLCICECGNSIEAIGNNLKRNHTTSCGCKSVENKKIFVERGIKHGLRRHPLYAIWVGMRNRCYYKKHNRYKYYGGKGIKVCDEWKGDFIPFYNWAMNNGWKDGLTIDRRENHLDYCPSNCRFATIIEQNKNRTTSLPITIDGTTKVVKDWAKEASVSYTTILKRLKNGWPPKKAVYEKKRAKSL